ncbi:hypothetical protein BS78_08G166100 [Paspalum vaginatum]|nr:hypothetical protein BS78_08G166100 [Paspalum vaginatum]
MSCCLLAPLPSILPMIWPSSHPFFFFFSGRIGVGVQFFQRGFPAAYADRCAGSRASTCSKLADSRQYRLSAYSEGLLRREVFQARLSTSAWVKLTEIHSFTEPEHKN